MGPDVKVHHSKLNFKWSDGGEEVKWHQDIPFYPHTNYGVLAIGLYLEDVDDEMGPMGIVRGSHKREIFDHYNDNDEWIGAIDEKHYNRIALDQVDWLKGPAGSVTVHHCRAVHGSVPNNSHRSRPLLINAYSAADALTVTAHPYPGDRADEIVRGKPARWIDYDPEPCLIPPDFSKGYPRYSRLNKIKTSQTPLNTGEATSTTLKVPHEDVILSRAIVFSDLWWKRLEYSRSNM